MTGSLRIEWRWLVGLLLLVVLFIPPRRYAIPAGLPFELDPYRLLVAGLVVAWILSALSDKDLRLRWSGLEAPLLVFCLAVVASLAANSDRVSAYQTEVVKLLSVLVGYILVFYFLVNVLRTPAACETVLGVLVLGGAILAVLAVVERKTGWSPFTDLDHYLPFIEPAGPSAEAGGTELAGDGRGTRARGSAEHAIALGALLAMLAPVAAALALMRRQAIWIACLFLLVLGSFATISRTPVLMLFAWALVFALLRWTDAKRFIPLALVAVAMIHFVTPGALGTLRASLSPSTVVEEQRAKPDSQLAAGRIADLGPSFEEFSQRPVFGHGFGTRVTVGKDANSRLLDNQWLGTLLDTGLVGLLGLAWLLGRFVIRTSLASLKTGGNGVVLAALAGAVFSYAIGMFLYDALAFTQVTLVLFILLAVGSALVLTHDPDIEAADKRQPVGTRTHAASLRPVDAAR